jgi:hypothetical protein
MSVFINIMSFFLRHEILLSSKQFNKLRNWGWSLSNSSTASVVTSPRYRDHFVVLETNRANDLPHCFRIAPIFSAGLRSGELLGQSSCCSSNNCLLGFGLSEEQRNDHEHLVEVITFRNLLRAFRARLDLMNQKEGHNIGKLTFQWIRFCVFQ